MESIKRNHIATAKTLQVLEDKLGMANAMKAAAKTGVPFVEKEYILFDFAFYQLFCYRRRQWKAAYAAERSAATAAERQATRAHRSHLTTDIQELVKQVVDVVNEFLIPLATTYNMRVLSCRMLADYYRVNMSVCGDVPIPEHLLYQCTKIYEQGYDLACEHLSPISIVKLELSFKYSNFLMKTVKQRMKAFEISFNTFLEAYQAEIAGKGKPNPQLLKKVEDVAFKASELIQNQTAS